MTTLEPVVTHHPAAASRRGTFDLMRERERIGFLSYSFSGDDTIMIDYVEVDPALRGSGLGRRLVEAAVAWAREHAYHVVPLCSYARAVVRAETQIDR